MRKSNHELLSKSQIQITFSTFLADVTLFTTVNDKVQCELLFALKCFHANRAHEWSFRIMGLLVPGKMVLTFECGIANVTNESENPFVKEKMLDNSKLKCNTFVPSYARLNVLQGDLSLRPRIIDINLLNQCKIYEELKHTWINHMTLWTAIQCATVERSC